MDRRYNLIGLALTLLTAAPAVAQDSVDVTFRYEPAHQPVRVFLPGEFNGWGPNSGGRIAVGAPSAMTPVGDMWQKTVRLRVGGGTASTGAGVGYFYKLHEHTSADGSRYAWLADPLNPVTLGNDGNSVVTVRSPMVFQLAPARNTVRIGQTLPVAATVAAKRSDPIDADRSHLVLDGRSVGSFGTHYDPASGLLRIASLADLSGPIPSGDHTLKLVAVTRSGATAADSTTFRFVVNPQVVNEALPAGIVDGINYDSADPTAVTLSLYAPRKQNVYVIGDFNGWQTAPAYFMKRDSIRADSARFWLRLTGLTPGRAYAFQYLVDGEIRIADPYAEQVLDPDYDAQIPAATYPDRPAYPTGKTQYHVSVLRTGQTPYRWQVDRFNRPDKRDLVIYELLVRDFLAAHDFATLADTLGYLQRLGINAIELLPVNEFRSNRNNWGYEPTFYFAPDKYYGPPEKLKAFIDEAHRRGIAVILDMVLNHAYEASPFVRLYNSPPFGPPTAENPWLNVQSNYQIPALQFGYDFNHESYATQRLVDRINRYWLTEYRVDGFRQDFTKGFGNNFKSATTDPYGSRYDADRIRLLKRMADRIWDVDSTAYVILEHLADNTEEIVLANYGMMLWGNLHSAYSAAVRGASSGTDLSWGNARARGWNELNLVTYMESHDEERLIVDALANGGTSGSYTVRSLPTALDRVKLAAAFFLTLPGPKMIWQFGELGYDVSIDQGGRISPKPIRWEYAADPARRSLFDTFSSLIRLRRAYPTFSRGNLNQSVNGAVKRVMVSDADLTAIVVGNFALVNQAVTPGFPTLGWWHEPLTGDSLQVTDPAQSLSLAPGQYRLFTSRRVAVPAAVPTAVGDATVHPRSFNLSPNQPNPFNPATEIRFSLARPGRVTLRVYDLLGHRVATLIDGERRAGAQTTRFEATGLPSGVYLYQLSTPDGTATRRMTLLR